MLPLMRDKPQVRPGPPLRYSGEVSSPEPAVVPRQTLIVGLMGNLLEWYDFGLYGYFAPLIAERFFPAQAPDAALVSTFGIFALGFLMRPIGSVVFGHFGDKIGRRGTLAASVLLMAMSTGLLGALPTYQQVGILAPILLTVLRLLQGLAIGGEYTGSMTFLLEHAPPSKRGRVGSWVVCSTVAGILSGSAMAALLTRLLPGSAWGWRVPFLLGALLGIVGLYIRLRIAETPEFLAVRRSGAIVKFPLLEALRHYRCEILTAASLTALQAAAFYLIFVYFPTYLSTERRFPRGSALILNTFGMGLLCILIPVLGTVSDRFGRRPQQIVGTVAYLVLAYPLFLVFSRGGFVACFFAHSAFAVIHSAICSPIPAMFVEMFPTRVRYSSVSLAFNIALAFFGGSAPLIANWLIRSTRNLAAPGFYLILSAGVTLAALLAVRETHGQGQN